MSDEIVFRQNSARLEEKERKEKEMLKVIIDEADEYKAEFYKKWKVRCENSRAVSREKEKVCGLKTYAVLLSMLQIELSMSRMG